MRRLAATAASPSGTYSHPSFGASTSFDGAEGQEIIRTGALACFLVNERVAPLLPQAQARYAVDVANLLLYLHSYRSPHAGEDNALLILPTIRFVSSNDGMRPFLVRRSVSLSLWPA
jgi:hypothetical protein